ncbi:MAG: P-loop NTPase fold protein, partial [Bacteroidota bacterium]
MTSEIRSRAHPKVDRYAHGRTQEGEPLVALDAAIQEFHQHLQLKGNRFLLFSGPFGTGKSFFLDEYFNRHRDTDVNAVFINPVNYVVSPNHDIFELIKVDVLRQLFTSFELSQDDNRIRGGLSKYSWLALENPRELLERLLPTLTKVVSDAIPAEQSLEEYNEVMNGFEILELLAQRMKEEPDEEKQDTRTKKKVAKLDKTWTRLTSKPGTHLEFDLVSSLVSDLLKAFAIDPKSGDKTRENILIIDDLDRLDPDHIFRMLNIFSAHQDSHYGGNKFGFDKVIVVGDLENIRHIFAHRYGPKTDFEGYIDKFYSLHPFEFSNEVAVDLYLDRLIDDEGDPVKRMRENPNHAIEVCTWAFFKEWAKIKKVRLRQLIKHRLPFVAELPEKVVF